MCDLGTAAFQRNLFEELAICTNIWPTFAHIWLSQVDQPGAAAWSLQWGQRMAKAGCKFEFMLKTVYCVLKEGIKWIKFSSSFLHSHDMRMLFLMWEGFSDWLLCAQEGSAGGSGLEESLQI